MSMLLYNYYNHWLISRIVKMSTNCDLLSGTLPEFVYKCAGIDRVAAVFDHEKITFTFADVKKK